jgi:hypothetical protein
MSKKKPQSGATNADPWLNSEAKAILREGIVSGNIADTMEAKEVYGLCPLFKEYNFDRFKHNLKTLREAVAKDYDRMAEDMEAFSHDVALVKILSEKDGPQPLPYPKWHQHEARHLLEKDVANGLHLSLEPREIYQLDDRNPYRDFPLDVFRNHIYQEIDKKASQKSRFAKKKLRAMMLQPRNTVLPAAEVDAVRAGAKVPERYATRTPNLQGVKLTANANTARQRKQQFLERRLAGNK